MSGGNEMKRLMAILLCTALLAGLLPGCAVGEKAYVPTGDGLSQDEDSTVSTEATTAEAEQELYLVYYPDKSLNPINTVDYTNRTILSLVYQSLFVVDQDYNVSPMLCKNYSVSDDMRVYTFYLADATFSDGAKLTAADVVASLSAARESKFYGMRFSSLYISDIYAAADDKVVVELNTAFENFPILLDIPIIKASEIDAEQPLGTGPYMLESTTSGMRLRRRSNWWCKSSDLAVTASAITLVEAESEVQVRDEFEFADVGLVCTDPGSDSYADYRADYELWDCENGMFLYLGFNCDSNSGSIFALPEIRAAVTYAIDREKLVQEYYRGFAWSATLPASPQSPYYSSSLAARYEYDPDRFAQVITDAGLQGYTVNLMVTTEDSVRGRVAKEIAKMLEAGGLYVNIVEHSLNDFTYVLNTHSGYDLYLTQTKLSPNMDLTPFFYVYGSLSYGGMDDSALYSLCRDALENQGNYYSLHKKVMDDGRICPILFRSYAVYASRGLLTNLNPARDNVFYYTIGLTMQEIQVAPEASGE